MIPLLPAVGYITTVTVGTGSGPAYGYWSGGGPYGSLTPTTLPNGFNLGASFGSMDSNGFNRDFLVECSGSVSNGLYFGAVMVQTASGWRYLSAKSAAYANSGTFTTWTWGSGSSPVWLVGDSGQARKVIFLA
jgi:hypothetical protein